MPLIQSDRFSRLIGNLWLAKPQAIHQLRQRFELPECAIGAIQVQTQIMLAQSIIGQKTPISNQSELAPTTQSVLSTQRLESRPTSPAPTTRYVPVAPPVAPATRIVASTTRIVASTTRMVAPATWPVAPVATVEDNPLQLMENWDELCSTIKLCDKCKLCYGRSQVVIERGNRNGRWMFIGEGPSEDEDLQGLPFLGSSGQLLDKMIAAMNLDIASEVYITNVVKCRPPQSRNPEQEEIWACNSYLQNQIMLVNPAIIITLGRYAAQTLLKSELALGKLRGKVHHYQEIPLIVTYHPDYLLRTPGAKKDAWSDLQLAMQVLK